jgi:hypothetical protein
VGKLTSADLPVKNCIVLNVDCMIESWMMNGGKVEKNGRDKNRSEQK